MYILYYYVDIEDVGRMTKMVYMHYVIAEYLSVTMACVLAMENYKQETAVNANSTLRQQFKACMKAYERIYRGRESWSLSTEDLVDYRTVAYLRSLAEEEVKLFLEKFQELIPQTGAEQFDFNKQLKDLKKRELAPAILSLVKELRKWEEEHIM